MVSGFQMVHDIEIGFTYFAYYFAYHGIILHILHIGDNIHQFKENLHCLHIVHINLHIIILHISILPHDEF